MWTIQDFAARNVGGRTFRQSVTVDRQAFAAHDNLGIGPHPRDLQVDYTSPTFSIAQKVTFRYTLDGYDDGWHEAGPRRQAFYTDVPPGKYTFRVMAANSDGVWNERAATLTFSVAPAYIRRPGFARSPWFRSWRFCGRLTVIGCASCDTRLP